MHKPIDAPRFWFQQVRFAQNNCHNAKTSFTLSSGIIIVKEKNPGQECRNGNKLPAASVVQGKYQTTSLDRVYGKVRLDLFI